MGKILITGCGGMLGKAIYDTFSGEHEILATDIDANEPWIKFLDVRNYESARKTVEDFAADSPISFIFHLAAITDLEFCEKHEDEAYRTNAMGTENMALIARDFDIPLIYISSAGIFDGKGGIYDDYSEPNPLTIYGKSKYMGEYFVKENLSKYFVLRAGWMMGGGKKDKKFIAKVMKQLLQGKKDLYVVADLYGSPTYTYDFAHNLKEVIKTNFYGVYNMVSEGAANRYEVTQELLRLLDLTDKIKLHKVPSSYYATEYFALRPFSEMLVNKN